MHTKLTLGERLKDLRIERGCTLEELAAQTGLSKAALGKYETNESGDVSLFAITTLAGFYDVTTDYLLGLVENKNRPDAALADLHLSDEAVDVLKSGKLNNRLFCELVTHPDSIIEKYDPKEDNTLRTLKAAQIDEDEYFARVVSNNVEQILIDLKQQHSKDTSSASADSPVAAFKESLEEISQVKGGKVEKLMMLFCKQNQINYSKLTDNEKHWLVEICKKSNLLKGGSSQRGKRSRT